jgi:hypothetical protein
MEKAPEIKHNQIDTASQFEQEFNSDYSRMETEVIEGHIQNYIDFLQDPTTLPYQRKHVRELMDFAIFEVQYRAGVYNVEA